MGKFDHVAVWRVAVELKGGLQQLGDFEVTEFDGYEQAFQAWRLAVSRSPWPEAYLIDPSGREIADQESAKSLMDGPTNFPAKSGRYRFVADCGESSGRYVQA